MKISARLLAFGLIAASFSLVSYADDKTPTPPDFSYNFLNIPLSTAEPPKADPLPLPDLSKNYSQINPKPAKTTPIAEEVKTEEPKAEAKPEPKVEAKHEEAKPTPKAVAKHEAVKPQLKAEAPNVDATKPEVTVPEVTAPKTPVAETKPEKPKAEPKTETLTPTASEPPVTSTTETPAAVSAPTTPTEGIQATVGTGFSSILNQEGDTVKVFLNNAATLPSGQTLPAGTQLTGKIESINRNKKRQPQDLKLTFTQATPPLSSPIAIQATPDTPDGVITAGNDVIGLKETHSYESLKGKLAKTLGADQSVYNQRLKVNSSQTGDYRKDAFIQTFHKNAVLVGSGDQLRLKFTP